MKTPIGTWLVLMLLGSACGADAQEASGAPPPDSARRDRIVLIDPGLALGRAVFSFPVPAQGTLSFGDPSMPLFPYGYRSGASFVGGYLEPRVDLMSPLRLQWEREKSMNTFMMVLGTLQAGAVGYIAIKHIEKYGLFGK